MTLITCSYCRKQIEKRTGEINRQLRRGNTRFFCDITCANKQINAEKRHLDRTDNCEYCGKEFTSVWHTKYTRFCSRECASAGSVTEYRRQRAQEIGIANKANLPNDIKQQSNALRKREWYRYSDLATAFAQNNIEYVFEYPFEDYPPDEYSSTGIVVDLYLPRLNLVIEFDEKYWHNSQTEYDRRRDNFLRARGCEVIRIPVEPRSIISVDSVFNILPT